jgi:hypothetical protein
VEKSEQKFEMEKFNTETKSIMGIVCIALG